MGTPAPPGLFARTVGRYGSGTGGQWLSADHRACTWTAPSWTSSARPGRRCRLRLTATTAGPKKRKLTVTTASVASIDVYVNDRPVATTATADGTTQTTILAAADAIRIEGYDDAGTPVAASQKQV